MKQKKGLKKSLLHLGLLAAAVLLALYVYDAAKSPLGRFARDNNAPFARFGSALRGTLSVVGGTFRDRASLNDENETLALEAAELRAKMLRFEELERENHDLRRALSLTSRHANIIRAEVVSRGVAASGWLKTVRIDKGEADGVKRFAPVVNQNGLVGRVLETTSRTADILLLADPNCKVSCYIEREGVRAHGVLSGGGFSTADGALEFYGVAKPLTVEYLGKDIEIKPGDRILTSGLGGAFPRGLPVGEVTAAATAPSGLFKTARVAPFVDFSTISLLFVLQPGFVETYEGGRAAE